MYSLDRIKFLNRQAAKSPKTETETTRHCSYAGSVDKGLVLHSAKQRSTLFVSAGRHAKRFLAQWYGTNSQLKRDALVESYF